MARITIPRKYTKEDNLPGKADRDTTIEMGPDNKYAVGAPSHFNKGWTCHSNQDAATRRYVRLLNDGCQGAVILDANGDEARDLMAASSKQKA